MSDELTYVTSSPSRRPSHYANLAMTPVKQEYYFNRRRFPNGINLPCWHHYVPSRVDYFFVKSENVTRRWYYAEQNLVDLKYKQFLFSKIILACIYRVNILFNHLFLHHLDQLRNLDST